ncbi:MAG: AMP-binding protein, partial [Micromonosporaceae bacterium]
MRFRGEDLSYQDLDLRSSQLGHVLADEYGVGPGSVVGVLLERGFELPISQLGVLKAGGAWQPLDPRHPSARLAYQVADANCPVVVTTSDLVELLPESPARLVLDDAKVRARLAEQPSEAPACRAVPEDTAYVIYTSGSTGAPKGVMVPHRAVVNHCANAVELFSLMPRDRLSQVANPSFDVSIFDFYAAFAAGAAVVAAPQATLLDPRALGEVLREERVTVAYVPPALLGLMDPEQLTGVRALMVAGEPIGAELANRWSAGREFHNGYGPTEATVTCVDYRCDQPQEVAPPIGQAMGNQRAYVLDRRWRLCPVGVPGELFMAGAGLARG